MLRPFHLAVTVHDIAIARAFYGDILGCEAGRYEDRWADFSLCGHQLVVHLDESKAASSSQNIVDGHGVPLPHFGIVLTMADWHALAQRLHAAGISFVIPPTVRFSGQPGEQATFFFKDPSGNALEFKAFANDAMLFAV